MVRIWCQEFACNLTFLSHVILQLDYTILDDCTWGDRISWRIFHARWLHSLKNHSRTLKKQLEQGEILYILVICAPRLMIASRVYKSMHLWSLIEWHTLASICNSVSRVLCIVTEIAPRVVFIGRCQQIYLRQSMCLYVRALTKVVKSPGLWIWGNVCNHVCMYTQVCIFV